MANIPKPSGIDKIWAASGDILTPSDSKIATGWQVEIPPRQTFNYIDNKQDQAIAHINQHGIAVWGPETEYQANASYAQGSDGIIYKALKTTTNVNPVGDTTSSWRVAFVDSTSSTGPVVATAAQARAQTDNSAYLSPLQLANAYTGTNQLLNSPGYQKIPGGLIVQWGVTAITASPTTITFPLTFPNQVFVVTGTAVNSVAATAEVVELNSIALASFQASVVRGADGQAVTTSSIHWIAYGK